MAQAIRTYKVVAFVGEADLKRKADSGLLELGRDRIIFHFDALNDIRYADMQKVEIAELFQVGTTIRITCQEREPISLLVPRVNFGGYAVVVNRAATHSLYDAIRGEWIRAKRESEAAQQ